MAQRNQNREHVLMKLSVVMMLTLGLSASPRAAGALAADSGAFQGSQPSHIDQAQPTINRDIGGSAVGGTSQQKLAQTITPRESGVLTQLDLPLYCSPSQCHYFG